MSPKFFISFLEKLLFKGLFNHRAKRGGSLFQGGSGKEEGSRSDPMVAGGSPSVRQFSLNKLS